MAGFDALLVEGRPAIGSLRVFAKLEGSISLSDLAHVQLVLDLLNRLMQHLVVVDFLQLPNSVLSFVEAVQHILVGSV